MIRKLFSVQFQLARRVRYAALAVTALFLVVVFTTVHFDIKGHLEGIFLLKGVHGWRYELKDDLYVGDGDRLLYGIDFDEPAYRLFCSLHRFKPGEPHLYYEWDAKEGSGYIRNFLGDGTQLLTCFGRYLDDDLEYVHGLFVGGGLPASVRGGDNAFMDETGMAFFDNYRWYHVWCNVNEGIASAGTGAATVPSHWTFLGSRVLNEGKKTLVISSSHASEIDGVPLRMDRYIHLNAGDTYFVLTVEFTNGGAVPVRFSYLYGDEPWVGNYGTSKGNVGWVKDRIIRYETWVDTSKYSYAGMYHYGNEAIGEEHVYTGTANFIEWFGPEKPQAYFANGPGAIKTGDGKEVPLGSNARFIGLEWGPRTLAPQQSVAYTMAIGMAGHAPVGGLPVKPEVPLPPVP